MLLLNRLLDQRLAKQPRVAVLALDPVRTAALAALVAATGLEVVSEHEADIVLSDRPLGGYLPHLVMSDTSEDFAGSQMPVGATVDQLGAALRAVATGLTVRLKSARPSSTPGRPTLTPREVEILGCLSRGLSNKSVARMLGISQHTVKFHLEAVFAKLQATSRAEAVAKGVRSGMITL